MARADYYADGQWNYICDLCGVKEKSNKAEKTWDNFYVCRKHKEVRNPQDFVRGVKDNQSVPWTRTNPADTFIGGFCTTQGRQAVAGLGVAGCLTPGLVSF